MNTNLDVIDRYIADADKSSRASLADHNLGEVQQWRAVHSVLRSLRDEIARGIEPEGRESEGPRAKPDEPGPEGTRPDQSEAQPEQQPVAWMHAVENDAGDQDYALSFARDNFPLKGLGGFKSLHVQPLYAHPAPAQPDSADARDAARYRYLRSTAYEGVIPHGGKLNGMRTAWITKFVAKPHQDAQFDESVDSAMREGEQA